jgi:hypothetical protein
VGARSQLGGDELCWEMEGVKVVQRQATNALAFTYVSLVYSLLLYGPLRFSAMPRASEND